jgi:dTDP-4-amino-4,6-dideoxygalactose transaminase
MTGRSVAFLDLGQVYRAYRSEFDTACAKALASGHYILGQEVRRFEKAFAGWETLSHCIGVGNGTDALVVALRALGIGPGDAVITVSHTAVATVAAIKMAGADPVLTDIEEAHYTLDPARLEETAESYSRSGKGTLRAVIAVHLYGQPCDLTAIRKVCARYNLKLVEDCAQAHGATWNGRRVGTFGDIATFSFYPTKNLGAFGDGGAVVTADASLAERARALRQYGWRERYISDIDGFNSRLDELQAAILSVRLTHLDDEIAARQRTARLYDQLLPTGLVKPAVRDGATHAYHLYVVRTPERDRLAAALRFAGVGTAIHYPVPVHLQPAYLDAIALGPAGIPVTERVSGDILSLPMHAFLSDEDVAHVAEVCTAVLKG